jgi:anti-sigma-K factor RskA
MSPLSCEQVDELAGAYALGAVDPDEDRSIGEHLATCDQPHAGARELIGAGAALAAGAEDVEPSPGLRDRLMATVAGTPQEHRPVAMVKPTGPVTVDDEPRRPWWRMQPVALGIAAVALALAIGLGAWGLNLNAQLAAREDALRAVASADATFAVAGSAGSGWVIESGDAAQFVAAGLAEPPPGQIYELWLMDADGNPTAVGTIEDPGDLVIVPLEQDLDGMATFAVTAEPQRVDAPTSDPVLVAPLEG